MKLPFRKIRGGKSADDRAKQLRERLSKVSKPWENRNTKFRYRHAGSLLQRQKRAKAVREWLMIFGLIGALCLALLAGAHYKGWTFGEAARHVGAFPNCSFARMLGVDKAKFGQPGYYNRHDADNDGIACEPIPAWKR